MRKISKKIFFSKIFPREIGDFQNGRHFDRFSQFPPLPIKISSKKKFSTPRFSYPGNSLWPFEILLRVKIAPYSDFWGLKCRFSCIFFEKVHILPVFHSFRTFLSRYPQNYFFHSQVFILRQLIMAILNVAEG